MLSRAGRVLAHPGWVQGMALMAGMVPGELTGLPVEFEPALALWLVIWQGARRAYPALDPLSLLRRLRFGWNAWRRRSDWCALRQASAQSQLGRALRVRNGLVHVIAWPYIHRRWTVKQRVDTVVHHYRHMERVHWLQVPAGSRRVVATIQPLAAGAQRQPALTLQVDQPDWLAQEGELALNLFEGDLRLYSLAFSLAHRDGRPVIYVGAIQGRSGDSFHARYAELTHHELHGCRPRDLIVLALLMMGESLGIEQVLAIRDAERRHRYPRLFRSAESATPSADYDQIWRDRGGIETHDGFFAMPTGFRPRPLADLPAKKRAMYRRRYDMLAQVDEQVHGLARANRVPSDLIDTPAR